MDELLDRLRHGTEAELRMLEQLLALAGSKERELRLAALHGAIGKLASEASWREVLVKAVEAAAAGADWRTPKILDSAQTLWLEEYVHQAVTFAWVKSRTSPAKQVAAEARERAEQALMGKFETPEESTNAWAALGIGLATIALGAALWWVGAPAFVFIAVARGLSKLSWGPPSRDATLAVTTVLIHIRKRREFTTVIGEEQPA
ncbi:MAG: hypothetical protein Q8K32_04875 [Archangium sp.]|nr:hypothetical protein [Archangium sp.]